ncbi:hypothetical protein MSAN_02027800 [Mycena sanguinolenta]|uniref:Uncharacterized protein n=1 Tax=Mycena sanguinolenta TaxID=230812 RepID=A0A8H7CM10_9AGAR|nr:hypothetical protein MSAN_02027800 [Mycena sanguinolenta]
MPVIESYSKPEQEERKTSSCVIASKIKTVRRSIGDHRIRDSAISELIFSSAHDPAFPRGPAGLLPGSSCRFVNTTTRLGDMAFSQTSSDTPRKEYAGVEERASSLSRERSSLSDSAYATNAAGFRASRLFLRALGRSSTSCTPLGAKSVCARVKIMLVLSARLHSLLDALAQRITPSLGIAASSGSAPAHCIPRLHRLLSVTERFAVSRTALQATLRGVSPISLRREITHLSRCPASIQRASVASLSRACGTRGAICEDFGNAAAGGWLESATHPYDSRVSHGWRHGEDLYWRLDKYLPRLLERTLPLSAQPLLYPRDDSR